MMTKIKSCVEYAKNLRLQVAEAVLLAERELAGKSGPEKRQIVVDKLDSLVKLPWILDDVLNVDGMIIGYMVDRVCNTLNILADGDFRDAKIDAGKLAAVAEAPDKAVMSAKAAGQTVDERLAALYEQYGIEAEKIEADRMEEDIEPPVMPPVIDDKWDRCTGIVGIAEGSANFDVINGKPVLKEKNKSDKGGLTNFGVTNGTLANAYAKSLVGHADITRLTKREAETIFRSMYCDPYGWLELPFEACLCLLDATINHGLGGTASISQRACNVMGYTPALALDGKWGPKTKAAVWKMGALSPTVFAAEFLRQRKGYFDRIIERDATQEGFRNGWYNRLRRIAKECGVASPV